MKLFPCVSRASVCAVLSVSLLAFPGFLPAAPAQYDSDTRAYNLAYGRVVFTGHCMRCHEAGRKGAPVLGEADDWIDRLDQSLGTLISHVIKGHGDMPPRGETELADQDIASAVAYVVSRARLAVAAQLESLPATGAGPAGESAAPAEGEGHPARQHDRVDRAVMNMLLLLVGKDRWR